MDNRRVTTPSILVVDDFLGHNDALGLRERVLLKGRSIEPWQVMAAADAFVMNSRFEGFPNAMLEAMGLAFAAPKG